MITICYPFVGDSIGGSHISTLKLIENLNKKKFSARIVIHKKGPLSKYLDTRKIKYEILELKNLAGEDSNLFNIIYYFLKSYLKIFHYIINNKIDIVHGNDLRINLTWGMSSKFLCKFIWHQRTFFKKNSKLWIPMFLFSNFIIFISKTVKNSCPKSIQKNGLLVFNPIPITKKQNKKKLRAQIKKKLRIKKSNKLVGFISRFTKNKGAYLLCDLITEICSKKKNISFILIGEGLEKESCKKILKKFQTNVKFLNFSHNPEKYFSAFDLTIAPSYQEGFGRTIVESLLANTPVLASDIPAHKEFFNSTSGVTFVKDNLFKSYSEKIYKAFNKKIDLKKVKSIVKLNFSEKLNSKKNF